MHKSIVVTLSLLLLSGTAFAKQGNSKGKKEKHQKQHKKSKGKTSKKFSEVDRYMVRDYYRNLPPGLVKKYNRTGTLPVGWQKKVNIGQQLPLEYRRNLHPIPRELRDAFGIVPVGSEVMRMGSKIIQLERATNIILDIFDL